MKKEKLPEEALKGFDISFEEILNMHLLWVSSNGKEGSKAVFMHVNFENFDFTNFEISLIAFKNCNLTNAKFGKPEKEIESTSFSLCNLTNAIFFGRLNNVRLEDCKINGMIFEKTTFSNTYFVKCEGEDPLFIKSIFNNSYFKNNKIINANLNSAKFLKCNFIENDFPLCDFAYIEALKCSYSKSNFLGADFHYSSFTSSKFEGTKFSSLASKNSTTKTSLDFVKFINCNFKECYFEEDEKSLKEKIIKTNATKVAKEEHLLNKSLFTTFALNIVLISNILALPFLMFNKTSILGFSFFCLGLFMTSSLFYNSFYHFKKIKLNSKIKGLKLKIIQYLKSRNSKILFIVPQTIMVSFWLYSLEFESFTISSILLSLFFISSFFAFFSSKNH